MLSRLSESLRNSFSDRVYIVSKIADKWSGLKIKKGIRECFPGLNEAKSFKALGGTQPG